MSVESTIKPFSRRKDGRGAFLALIANHADDVKYRAIAKKRQNLSILLFGAGFDASLQ